MITRLKSWWERWGKYVARTWEEPARPNPPQKLEIVRVESQKITLAQWRTQTISVGASMELAQHPIYRAQRDILESQHPRHVMLKLGSTEIDRVVHQARTEGYERCLWNMDLLAIPIEQKPEIHATFEPPVQEK